MSPPSRRICTARWILRGSGWAALRARSTGLLFLERLGAADDLHQLLGDRGLPRLVVLEREGADHLLGVLGGRVHRGHARAELARLRLVERAEDRDVDVHGYELLEQRALVGLVDELHQLGAL